MSEYRLERIGRLIQELIGSLIVEGRIKDPRVDPFLSVTRVRVSRDLSFADVYVSGYQTSDGPRKGIAGLQSAAGFIQAQLNAGMRIRQIPRLRFHEDPGLREGFEMIKKIEGLVHNDGP
ncbi:MAG: 30S ribosome-binding factor RbfA [Spirochaetaceae bacterium]|jgi:ribosome-binding factor A|nr:30S ribosome-binding factor RbfA [Spirochaetaceae bacterium]